MNMSTQNQATVSGQTYYICHRNRTEVQFVALKVSSPFLSPTEPKAEVYVEPNTWRPELNWISSRNTKLASIPESLCYKQARTQKFLKGGGLASMGNSPKICNSTHEMTLLEASTASVGFSGCNLNTTPVTHKYDWMGSLLEKWTHRPSICQKRKLNKLKKSLVSPAKPSETWSSRKHSSTAKLSAMYQTRNQLLFLHR